MMRWIQKLRLRLRSIALPTRVERELDEEISFHLEQQIEENIASGMSPEEARFTAGRTIGGVAWIKEECRDKRRVNWITDSAHDVRYALRTFRRAPVFVVTVVIALGLGIGANTAIFSIADALLLKSLPVPEPKRLIQILQPDGQVCWSMVRTSQHRIFAIWANVSFHSLNFLPKGRYERPRQ